MFKVAIHMANLFKLTKALLLAIQNHSGQCHTKLAMPKTLFKKKRACCHLHSWKLVVHTQFRADKLTTVSIQ